MNGTYDLGLVALSVVIAILASGAALDLANRVTAARGRARALWLAGGAFAMGSGIWSMHYVGMLAFRLPVPVLYDVPTVLVSWLPAPPPPAPAPPFLGGPEPAPPPGAPGGRPRRRRRPGRPHKTAPRAPGHAPAHPPP